MDNRLGIEVHCLIEALRGSLLEVKFSLQEELLGLRGGLMLSAAAGWQLR